jgi:hypothetical protein
MPSMSSKILFPFRSKYSELGLKRRWWHRFAIVLFGVAMTVALLTGVWLAISDYGEKNVRIDSALNDSIEAKGQLDANASPAENQAIDQRYEEQRKQIDHDANVSLFVEIGFTVVLLAALSYLLQLLYRVLIYVVYGNKREPEHSTENAV